MPCPQRGDRPLERRGRLLARRHRRRNRGRNLRLWHRLWRRSGLRPCRRRLKDFLRRGLGRSGLSHHFDHLDDFDFRDHGLADGLQPAKLGGQIEDILLVFGRRRAPTQDPRDVVDDPIVGLPFRGLKTFVVLLARRGGTRPRRTRLVVRDDPADGGQNLLHRRFRSPLCAAHDLIPYRHFKPPASPGGQTPGFALECPV